MIGKYFIIGGDNYNTLGMIRTLGEANIPVEAIIIKSDYVSASKSKYINSLHKVSSIEEGYSIVLSHARKKEYKQKDFLLVEGDANTEFLDAHYEELKDYYFYNQAQGKLGFYMNKYNQVKLAEKHGFHVMKTWTVDVGAIPEDIVYPVTTKAVNSRNQHWKSEVFICNSEAELRKAYQNIHSPQIILQQFVEKENELCLDGFSINRGKDQFVAIGSKYNYLIPGKYSFALTMFNYHDQEMIKKITETMSDVGYEGIYSIEFLIDKQGNYNFLEINFRNSGWSYASTCAGMPLPILWAMATVSNKIEPEWEKTIKEGFQFIDDYNDFRARVRNGKMKFSEWYSEYKQADCRLTMGKNDPRPLRAYLFSRLTHKIRKKLHYKLE